MARKAIYKHATQVNTSTYPDDGSSPVGSNEWNESPDPQGMYGNTPATSTITIASGVATVTDSVTVVAAESSTSDTLQKLALTNTNEYDLVYLFADTGDTITLEHGDLNADGEISTISGANETLSTTTPTILMRKGNYWYGYGGGAVTTPTDITVADSTDTTCFPALFESATGDLAPKTDAGITYNAGTGVLTATGFAGPITGNVTGNASGSSATCSGLSATATALATARTIGGTSFDGTANIAVGLSATTTALATARTIGGVSFDGTANINLPGVNASGTQDTSGTSAIATAVTISDNESTNESNLLTFTSGGASTGNIALESDGDLNYNPSTGQLASTKVYGLSELRTGGNLILGGDLDATTSATDVDLIDNNASALSFDSAGKAGILEIVTTDSSEKVKMSGSLEVTGDLTINGTTTTINSTTLTVDDKNIEMGSVGTPSDTTANLGGITLKGATDKTIIWDNANDNWTSNQDWNIATGKVFKINNVDVKNVAETLTNKTLTSPTLTTPALGTPSALVGTNITGTASNFTATTVTTNANLTGDVTSSGNATTIATDAVDIAMLSATGTASSSTYLRGDNSWQAISSGFTATADADLTFVGDYDIHDLQRVCFEVQSTGFTLNATHNENRTGEQQMFVRTIDANTEGLFVRLKKNGASNYEEVQLA